MSKVYRAVRRKEREGEDQFDPRRCGFFEKIELFDIAGKTVAMSGVTHPESYFISSGYEDVNKTITISGRLAVIYCNVSLA